MKRFPTRKPVMAWCVAISAPVLAFVVLAQPVLAQFPSGRTDARRAAAVRKKSRASRESGTIYLKDFTDQEIKVAITRPVGLYTTLSGANWLGNLLPNQQATLLAVSDRAYRVRGRAKQGQVAGWIGKYAVEGISDELIEGLEKLHARQMIVDDLISKRQVALGMTIEEVEASIGSPDRRHSNTGPTGRIDIYEYVTYDRVPHTTTSFDPWGYPVQTTVWIKVESGRVTISFKDGVISSVEESEGVDFAAESGRIVPPPIFLFP